jgi:hypothetical protein
MFPIFQLLVFIHNISKKKIPSQIQCLFSFFFSVICPSRVRQMGLCVCKGQCSLALGVLSQKLANLHAAENGFATFSSGWVQGGGVLQLLFLISLTPLRQ